MPRTSDYSIVAVDKFIQATRDSGYKGTASAICELVDNALQAGARNIAVDVVRTGDDDEFPLRISVVDDGCGMDGRTLRQALRFGGSSRFDDRGGLGRFGMGLPNSSLSQARRLDVYTWTGPRSGLFSYLDVDEIAAAEMTEVPASRRAPFPRWFRAAKSPTGTLVVWTRCDRLDHRRATTIARRLSRPLGQVFRYFLWEGVRITVNGVAIEPVDPLYLHPQAAVKGAQLFGKPIEYDVEARAANGHPAQVGKVVVRFTELPVGEWHDLSNDDKRQMGIANGAGVSVVRADREIDYGWFFMGGKRRENYDDWWRCEIQFDPVLDEAFGITHTKQQIRPQDYLQEILSQDLGTTAKALNSRVRQAHFQIRAASRTVEVEQLAADRENLLKPLPQVKVSESDRTVLRALFQRHPAIKEEAAAEDAGVRYRIVHDKVTDPAFFSFVVNEGLFVLLVNPDHPFYRKVYKPLIDSDSKDAKELRSQIDLMLLSCARAEASATRASQKELIAQVRKMWSDNLATFLNG